MDIRMGDRLFAAKEGLLHVSDVQGEWLFDVAVPQGLSVVADLVPGLEPGMVVTATGVRLMRREWCGVIAAPEALDSGANPDFKPSSATRQAMQMDHLLGRLRMQERRLEARLKSLDTIERIPANPASVVDDAAPVIE